MIDRMPFTLLPSWWMSIWPSRTVGVFAWFGLLNAAGTLIAAIPVAILLMWLIDRNRTRAAFTVGVLVALAVIGPPVAGTSSFGRPPTMSVNAWLMTLELFLLMFLAVPFLIWAMRALPSNKWFKRSRAAASFIQRAG